MKQLLLLILVVVGIISSASAQNEGINFEHPEWTKIIRKAAKEKKMIFIDCYTSWCGPCKDLAKKIFSQKEVGDFYNSHFISTKVDMDKDAMAAVLKKKFKPAAYPTLLFLNGQSGNIVHMVVGGGDAKRILSIGAQALDADNNLAGLTQKYESGERNPAFMVNYLKALSSSYQKDKHLQTVTDYFASLPPEQFETKEIWDIFKDHINNPLSPAFRLCMDKRQKFHEIAGRKDVDQVLQYIINGAVRSIVEPSVYATLSGEKTDEAKNKELTDYLHSIDFEYAPTALAYLYTAEYGRKNDFHGMWNSIQSAYRYNIFRNGEDYMYIWHNIPALAEGTNDPEILQAAADLMDRLDQEDQKIYYRISLMNGKAKLLEKKGDKAGAEKASALADRYREKEMQMSDSAK